MTILTKMRRSAYVLLLALQLTSCAEPPPAEQAITRALEKLEKAVEENKPLPVLNLVHEDFSANRSGRDMSRLEAEQLVKMALRRHRNINVVLTNIRVEPDPVREDVAMARFNAVVTSSSRSRFLPEDGQLYRVDTEWRLEDDWQLYRLESRRALE